jgi:hypothetical protein
MADKLGIPIGYLRRLREEHLGLYDANVNGWLEHQPGRRLLIRTLRGEEGDGIARGGAVGAVPVRGQPRRAACRAGRHPERGRGRRGAAL